MRKLLLALGVVAGLLVLAVIVGLMLPREHRAASRITVPAPPDSVWAVVRNLEALPAVWSDLRSSRRDEAASAEHWVQSMADGFELRIAVSAESPPTRLVTDIVPEPGAPFGGRWIYELRPEGGGTALTVTEDGWVANPVFRLVSVLAGHHATLDSYLRAIGQRFGNPADPEHLP